MMFKKYITVFTLSIVLAVFHFASSQAQSANQTTLEKILQKKTLVVGTTGNQFPFTFLDKKDELEGIDIKIAKLLAKELGVEVKFQLMSFENLLPALIDHKVDIVFSGLSISTQRNTKVIFPGVYYKSGKSILSENKELSQGDVEVVNKADVSLAVINSTTSESFVQNKYPLAKVVELEDIAEGVKLLKEGKVDGLVSDIETCELISFTYTKNQLYFENLSSSIEKDFMSPAIATGDMVFMNLISNFIQRINTLDQTNAIDLIWDKYLKYQ